MFTDSHCHLNRLNLENHDGDLAGAIDAMKQANVTRAMAIIKILPNMTTFVISSTPIATIA